MRRYTMRQVIQAVDSGAIMPPEVEADVERDAAWSDELAALVTAFINARPGTGPEVYGPAVLERGRA